ncbi:MAG: DUF167 domain-containing protein [Phycisphaerales bacterium]|nr:DUF167 domain-containing protein [Phycisphaerales bacterium]
MSEPLPGLDLRGTTKGVEFSVKVVPGASRTGPLGLLGGALKLAVSAPPEGGKANAAVLELLVHILGVRKSDVQIVSGASKPRKRIAVTGLSAEEIRQRLHQVDS